MYNKFGLIESGGFFEKNYGNTSTKFSNWA